MEFAWMITLQYHSAKGPTIYTGSGTVKADPNRDTRASLLSGAVQTVKDTVGVQDGVVMFAYLERNAL